MTVNRYRGIGHFVLALVLIAVIGTAKHVGAQSMPFGPYRTSGSGQADESSISEQNVLGADRKAVLIRGGEDVCNTDDGTAVAGKDRVDSWFRPSYKVISILYAPPGNKSSESYGDVPTAGTRTAISKNFTFGDSMSYARETSITIPMRGYGNLRNSLNMDDIDTFTQVLTAGVEALGYDDDPPPSLARSNAIDHNRDAFAIWLNPLVMVQSRGDERACYSVGAQSPNAKDVQGTIADIMVVPAYVMEAAQPGIATPNPAGEAGVSTVPVTLLTPQVLTGEGGTRTFMPGLGAICSNNELYRQQLAADMVDLEDPPEICTQDNQCGCTPADFSGILETDPLLNYNSAVYSARPYPETMTPLQVDSQSTSSGPGSGPEVCGMDTVPSSANCRYVVVPRSLANTEETPQPAVPTQVKLTYQQESPIVVNDSTVAAKKLAGTTDEVVPGVTGDGPLLSDLSTPGNWTWTDLETVGNPSHAVNTMTLTLVTSTRDCHQEVNVYEDTVYHTFAFQVPDENASCASDQTITFEPLVSPVTLGSSPIALSAVASSGLPVAFQVVSGPGSLRGNILTITEAGVVVVAATQSGNVDYARAAPVTQRITAIADPPSFVVTAVPDNLNQTALSLGHSISYTITVSSQNGFSSPVQLDLSGLPPGVSYRFLPALVSTPGKARLILASAYSASTYIGYSTLTITGMSGRLTSSRSLTLITRRLQYKSACTVQ